MPSYQAPVFAPFGRNEYLRSTRGHIFEHYTLAASAVPADTAGNKTLQSGTVLARITAAAGTSTAADVGKVGPYSLDTVGVTDGRSTSANIVGICDSFYPYQLTRGDREVAALKHGRVVAAACYEYAAAGVSPGTRGISAATQAALIGKADLQLLVV